MCSRTGRAVHRDTRTTDGILSSFSDWSTIMTHAQVHSHAETVHVILIDTPTLHRPPFSSGDTDSRLSHTRVPGMTDLSWYSR